jgi:hypothetical protein
MEIIVADFPLQPNANNQANRNTDRQAEYIQQGEGSISRKVAPGDFEIVLDHSL